MYFWSLKPPWNFCPPSSLRPIERARLATAWKMKRSEARFWWWETWRSTSVGKNPTSVNSIFFGNWRPVVGDFCSTWLPTWRIWNQTSRSHSSFHFVQIGRERHFCLPPSWVLCNRGKYKLASSWPDEEKRVLSRKSTACLLIQPQHVVHFWDHHSIVKQRFKNYPREDYRQILKTYTSIACTTSSWKYSSFKTHGDEKMLKLRIGFK